MTTTKPVDPSPLAIPADPIACVHVEMGWPKGLSEPPVYRKCSNTIPLNPINGYLCGYHAKKLLRTIKITTGELEKINFNLNQREESNGWTVFDNIITDGILKTEAQELSRFPVKRLCGLRVQVRPALPTLYDKSGKVRTPWVNPEWERVKA